MFASLGSIDIYLLLSFMLVICPYLCPQVLRKSILAGLVLQRAGLPDVSLISPF